MFDFVDDVAAREERLVPMTRAHANPDSELAQCEIANTMHACRVLGAEVGNGRSDDALSLLDRERLEGFVFEMRDVVALIVIAHPAFERAIAAAARVFECLAQRLRVDGFMGETEHLHVALSHPRRAG